MAQIDLFSDDTPPRGHGGIEPAVVDPALKRLADMEAAAGHFRQASRHLTTYLRTAGEGPADAARAPRDTYKPSRPASVVRLLPAPSRSSRYVWPEGRRRAGASGCPGTRPPGADSRPGSSWRRW